MAPHKILIKRVRLSVRPCPALPCPALPFSTSARNAGGSVARQNSPVGDIKSKNRNREPTIGARASSTRRAGSIAFFFIPFSRETSFSDVFIIAAKRAWITDGYRSRARGLLAASNYVPDNLHGCFIDTEKLGASLQLFVSFFGYVRCNVYIQ